MDKKAAKALAKKNRRAGGSKSKTSTTKVRKSRPQGGSSSSPSGSARVTVRRQRH